VPQISRSAPLESLGTAWFWNAPPIGKSATQQAGKPVLKVENAKFARLRPVSRFSATAIHPLKRGLCGGINLINKNTKM